MTEDYILQPFKENSYRNFIYQFGTASENERRMPSRDQENRTALEWRWCALCCAKMILRSMEIGSPQLVTMYSKNVSSVPAAANKAIYRSIDGKFSGAYHKPLALYLRSFGLAAVPTRGINTMEAVTGNILADNFIIASVGVNLWRWQEMEPDDTAGHMVLIYGARVIGDQNDKQASHFFLHNPAGVDSKKSAKGVEIPALTLIRWMNGNAVLVLSEI